MNKTTPRPSVRGRAPAIALSPSRRRAFTSALAAVGVLLTSTPTAFAASDTWDNGAADDLWQSVANWAADTMPGTASAVYTSTDDATFSTTGAGGTIDLGGTLNVRSLIFGVSSGDAASFTIGDANDILNFTTAGGITINSGVTTAQNIGVSGTTINLSSDASAATTFTNNGTGLLTIAGNIAANTASGNGVLTVGGTGNTTVTGTITKPGAGSNALKKTGSGTLTLSNGSVWSGTGATQSFGAGTNGNSALTSPFIVQEGTLLLNGGTHAVTGEAVIGGIVAQGGAGQNATVQIDSGSLTVSSWFSIGRGNGVGGVSSDLVLNNAASVTALNLSAGYNGGNALNLPKVNITLNGTSSLTVTNTATNQANFILGESDGSNVTMTLNDNATVTKNGGSVALGSSTQAGVQIGKNAGTGTVIMNGGTFNARSVDLGRGSNNTQAVQGTLTVNAGTFNSEGDFRMGFAGSAAGQATVNLNGGTLNIGSTAGRWMILGYFDPVNSTVNIGSGNLNLNSSSSIQFSLGNNQSGNNVINQTGGNVTFYSNNATTVGGTGVLNMQNTGSASSKSTYNLNGGTLTANQVTSSATTGTRTFNFNGGTLKAGSNTYASTFFNLGSGTGTARANVRNGGALIDTNGFDVTVAQALLHSNVGGDNATDGGLTKSGTGILTLSGANTYNGNTTISAGTLAVSSTGALLFDVADASSTQILGTGALTFDGTLKLNLSGVTVGSGSWTLVNVGTLTESFAGTFAVADNSGGLTFSENSNVWTSNDSLWSFSEATGVLTLGAIPEPSTYAAIFGALALAGAAIRRRRKV